MLDTLLTLLIFQTLGEGLVYLVGLPVPGPVIGMLLLLAVISVGIGSNALDSAIRWTFTLLCRLVGFEV